MHILFVDESGHAPSPDKATSQPLFVLGGIVIPEDTWPRVRLDLNQLKARYRVTGEIKWRFFAPWRPGRKENALSHLTADEKEQLKLSLLGIVAKYKALRVIAVVVDTVKAYNSTHLNSADDLYHDAYKQLSERFQYFLQDLEREAGARFNGMIVCDNRNNDQDSRLKEFHQALLNGGQYTSTYNNFIEGLFIAASHHSVGTQFADLVAGAVYRAEAHDDHRYFDVIEPSFRRSPAGKIDGYGRVRIPRRAK